MTEIMRRIEPLERYSGLLLAILLLFVAAPLNVIVYSTAGVKGTDKEDALKTLPAVAAHPAGFVIAGLVFMLLGGAVWLFSRAIAKRLSARAQSQLRFGNALGLLATGLLVLYGLYIGIRLPWIASGFAHNPSDAADAFTSYLEISGALLQAAYVALGGWLFFLCLAMWREKTVSRYLTLLGIFCALVLILAVIADPIIVLLAQFCGFFWALGVGFALLRPAGEREKPVTVNVTEPEAES
jgi:Domain of unknown function (DUF4386)